MTSSVTIGASYPAAWIFLLHAAGSLYMRTLFLDVLISNSLVIEFDSWEHLRDSQLLPKQLKDYTASRKRFIMAILLLTSQVMTTTETMTQK